MSVWEDEFGPLVRAGARLYGVGWVERWRDLDISELTVLLSSGEETRSEGGKRVPSTRDLVEQQRLYEQGRAPKPERPPSGLDLFAAAMQYPGLVRGTIPDDAPLGQPSGG